MNIVKDGESKLEANHSVGKMCILLLYSEDLYTPHQVTSKY